MVDVLLKQLAPTVLTYHAKNLQLFDIVLDMPSTTFALPESDETQAQVIKVEGNIMAITFSWTLLGKEGDGTLVDELTGGSAVEEPEEQRDFLLNTFQSKGIDFKYEFELSGVTPAFKKEGLVTKIVIKKTGDDPVQYLATITFTVGSVIVTAADS